MILRLQSGAVMSRSTSAASNARSSSSWSSAFAPVSVSTCSTCFAFLEEHAVHRTFDVMTTGS